MSKVARQIRAWLGNIGARPITKRDARSNEMRDGGSATCSADTTCNDTGPRKAKYASCRTERPNSVSKLKQTHLRRSVRRRRTHIHKGTIAMELRRGGACALQSTNTQIRTLEVLKRSNDERCSRHKKTWSPELGIVKDA
jgi:hypothetical protein